MSYYSTASTAMEHDTARRLEALDPSNRDRLARRLSDIRLDHGRLDHGRLDRGRLDQGRLDQGRLVRDLSLVAASGSDAAPRGDQADVLGEEGAHLRPAAPSMPRDPARDALDCTCLTVKRIAHEIGMPRATLEAYRLGTRRMPQTARIRLGTYLAAHAAMLDGLAQALMSPPKAPPPADV